MAQTTLNDEASESLHHLSTDVEAALRYLTGEAIPKEHVERWSEALKTILDGRVVHARPGRKTGKRASTDA